MFRGEGTEPGTKCIDHEVFTDFNVHRIPGQSRLFLRVVIHGLTRSVSDSGNSSRNMNLEIDNLAASDQEVVGRFPQHFGKPGPHLEPSPETFGHIQRPYGKDLCEVHVIPAPAEDDDSIFQSIRRSKSRIREKGGWHCCSG